MQFLPLSSPMVRVGVVLAAGALTATALTVAPEQADAGGPCRVRTSTHLDSSMHFAGGGVLRRYTARAHGSAAGGYDQKGKVIMTSYPRGAFPSLINAKVGTRRPIGRMVKNQRRHAIGAINGDFFSFPDIRYANDVEMSRGPMVREGKVIRGTYKRQRVVGVTMKREPFGGMIAVRGSIHAQTRTAPRVDIRSMNWHRILGGGVNIYTTQWLNDVRSDGKADVPRPAGVVEWVLNSHNKIKTVRNRSKNSGQRGNTVKPGTRVLAFSKNSAQKAKDVRAGTKVSVNIQQSTDSGERLFTAVGRGLPMVLGGNPAPLGCNAYDHSKAARPRTFVGWNGKGHWRSFTVPGRTFDDIGLRTGGFGLANAANIAKSLGMKRAYELDGGGSTTAWTRSGSGKWTRRDLYGVNTRVCSCQRPMTNGLAFVK